MTLSVSDEKTRLYLQYREAIQILGHCYFTAQVSTNSVVIRLSNAIIRQIFGHDCNNVGEVIKGTVQRKLMWIKSGISR
jgi:hypothetical protein